MGKGRQKIRRQASKKAGKQEIESKKTGKLNTEDEDQKVGKLEINLF